MQQFMQLIKQSNAYQRLNKNAQSYLFCSFDSLALALAAQLFVDEDCGKATQLSHPDIMVLPQKEGERVITSDITLLNKSAISTPLSLKNKYFVIKNAHTMTDTAFNRLLKTLEEPPSHAKIILLADSENSLSATIRSRCQILRLDSLPIPVEGTPADELHLNSLSRLKKAQSGAYDQPLRDAINMLLFLKKSSQIALYAAAFSADRDKFAEIVDMVQLVLHETTMYHACRQIRLKSYRADIAKIAAFYGLDCLIRLQSAINEAKRRLFSSGNLNSIVDELLFALLSVRQKYSQA